ncbi:hypothetical protein GW927_03445 [Candidatus Pacearchaeota archaeon]|nr:hypothetical protein [Candidatus Pacearchaeota archaeon]
MKSKSSMLRPLFLFFLTGYLLVGRVSQIQAASSDDAVNYARKNPEIYNYLPLVLEEGYSLGDTGTVQDTITYQMAYNQGYEVQCVKPKWWINGQVHGAIEEYFEEYDKPVRLTAEAVYDGRFAEGKIPLFQGDEDFPNTTKVSSYDGFFGANNQQTQPAELNSAGAATSLMSPSQQCIVKYNNLYSIYNRYFCDKFKDPGSPCYVNQVEIPGTDYGGLVLFAEMHGLLNIKSKTNPDKNFSCTEIMGVWNPEMEEEFGISENDYKTDVSPVRSAITAAPLNLDGMYRLAFLIVSIKQNVMEGNELVNPALFESNADIFDFLQIIKPEPNPAQHPRMPVKKHAPIVIGFKVPMTATNMIFSMPGLMDSARLTSYLYSEPDRIQAHIDEMKKDRKEFLGDILAVREGKKDAIINCGGLPQCIGGAPDKILMRSLIDQVNGSGLDCAGFNGSYEIVSELGSMAIVDPEQRELRDPFFSFTFPSDNKYTFDWNIIVKDTVVNGDLDADPIAVRGHLITPYGADMEYINKTLQQLFTTEQFKTIVENNCVPDFNGACGIIPEYLTFINTSANLKSKTDTFSFIYHQPPGCSESCNKKDEDEGDCIPCERKQFTGVTVEHPDEPMRILGAELGWTIRKIQEYFREMGSKTYEYVTSCERTEDLFLGRCKGYDRNNEEPGTGEEESCDEIKGRTTKLPTMNELMKMTCSVAGNDPNDAQMLWGFLQIEGSPMLRKILAGEKEMSCGEIITNACGASGIVGVLIPQCIDKAGCPQAAYIADDTSDPWVQEARNNPDIGCDIKTSMEYVLRKRKSERGWLVEQYKAVHGTTPSTQQLYYMMAGRNYGVPTEYLTTDACAGYEEVDGCGGANYCVCTMDTFKLDCGNIR